MKPSPSDFAPGVLVIAPDPDLKHSLAFMLKAEGFSVETGVTWPSEYRANRPDAIVIDHAAFPKGYSGDEELTALGRKVVILAGRNRLLPPLPEATVVRKPLLDRALIDTLRALVPEQPERSK
ncbi:hypothetical protein [Asticcacaulis sp.]|uniref:hypothetical protein n=1 Tax=Asticcacaulis sp. TaxID=1872648 RepID=UPI002C4DF040|nr:hypothetical protein [Asticcacaulis sp.]HTM82820.1 hypothetical protein [Asticcacaulis sp.]